MYASLRPLIGLGHILIHFNCYFNGDKRLLAESFRKQGLIMGFSGRIIRFCNEKGVYIVSNMKNTSQIMAVYSHLVCMEKHRN